MYPDIFISYKREDVELVKVIAKELTNYGWVVWWDHNIPAGKDYDTVILDALSNAKSVLVIWSSKSINSRNVKDEANVGLERGVLIPILIGNIKAPIGFRMIQSLKWNDNNLVEPEELNDLIYQLKLLVGEPAAAEKNILRNEAAKTEMPVKSAEETAIKTEPAFETETYQPELIAGEFEESEKKHSKKNIFIISGIAVLAALAGIYFYTNSNRGKNPEAESIQTNNDVAVIPKQPVNTDTSAALRQNVDSTNKAKESDSVNKALEKQKLMQDSVKKVLERQKFMQDSVNNLPDKLITEAVFNLQQYAKDKGIKRVAVNGENESDSVFEFKDASSAIRIPGLLRSITNSKKITLLVVLKPGNTGTGGIVDAAYNGRYGFYIGLQQYKPRVDIFYGSDKHAPREDFMQVAKEKWNMLVLTYSYNDINVQVNNKPVQKTDSWGHDIVFAGNAADFVIGGRSIYSGVNFTGLMGNLLLYDRCLTDDEVNKLKELYREGKLGKTL